MRKVFLIMAVLAISGCTRSGIIEHNINRGLYSFTPAESAEYDYDVRINRDVDFGWNTGKSEDRMRVIHQMLGNSCQSPVIVEEQLVDRGSSAIGTKKGVYFIKLSCPK